MRFLAIILLVIQSLFTAAQSNKIIQINDSLTAHHYEFSSLAKWKNFILLVPQNRKNVVDSVFMIDTSAINQSIQKNIFAPHIKYAIKNLKHIGPRKDSLYIDDILLTKYDGFEAAVTKKDTIFFSLETDTSFCYLIKGVINQKEKSIEILHDTLHIPNTYNINNAGYESLALLPHKNSLISFFECNKDANARAFIFNTSLKSKPKPIEWAKPLYFRITDAYALNDTELIGINRLFTAPFYTSERDAYLQGTDLAKVKKQITNGGNLDMCFDQLIKIYIRNNKIYWQPLAFISLNILDNYEGIVPFKNGVLMVVDGETGNAPCKLVYQSLK